MKDIINHLLWQGDHLLRERTLLNCHAIGLHSIMLYDSPGNRLRLFFADEGHYLWSYKDFSGLSIGFHPHHCDVTLSVLQGVLTNYSVSLASEGPGFMFHSYRYHSKIREGKGGFEHVGAQFATTPIEKTLYKGDFLSMPASQIHTVQVKQGKTCIWAVMEGREDDNYQSILLSTNHELERDTMSGLYKTPTAEEFAELVNKILELL